MDDILISRQAVLDAIDAYKYLDGNDAIYRLKQWLNEQECVQPKIGHWTILNEKDELYSNVCICSECNHSEVGSGNYCRWCGAKMECDAE